MNAIDLKPIYAENNATWRIRYASNGNWELQEFRKLLKGADRSREQNWITYNRNMSYRDAIRLLGTRNLTKGAVPIAGGR